MYDFRDKISLDENIETQKSLFDYMGSTTNMNAGANYRHTGLNSNPYEMKNPHGGTENLDWLLIWIFVLAVKHVL